MNEDQQLFINWEEVEKRVFSIGEGGFLVGGKKLTPEVRDILREQAKYFQTSQLWEILNSSTLNEALNTGFFQSKDFSHTEFGKAMWHYSAFIRNIILQLAKD